MSRSVWKIEFSLVNSSSDECVKCHWIFRLVHYCQIFTYRISRKVHKRNRHFSIIFDCFVKIWPNIMMRNKHGNVLVQGTVSIFLSHLIRLKTFANLLALFWLNAGWVILFTGKISLPYSACVWQCIFWGFIWTVPTS